MARCLIIACGRRGVELAGELRHRGHVVRGTTRRPERVPQLDAAGIEGVVADPDRLATLVPALEHVGVIVVLLGSATGEPTQLSALHGPRLESLLRKLLDTTVRGVVYEAAGTVPEPLLSSGAAAVARDCGASRVPHALIEVPRTRPEWLGATLAAVDAVLPGGAAESTVAAALPGSRERAPAS